MKMILITTNWQNLPASQKPLTTRTCEHRDGRFPSFTFINNAFTLPVLIVCGTVIA